MESLVVTLDGPAGAGKSSVAAALAARLGIPYLDTGAMYRAVAWFALERALAVSDPKEAERATRESELTLEREEGGAVRVLIQGRPVGQEIRQPQVSLATSQLAVHPRVRDQMVSQQREFLRRHGGVLEGRDTGTHVAPDAPFKFYLDARPEVRIQRRCEQLRQAGHASDRELVVREIAERDERDRNRETAPLVPAADAVRIDTSNLSVDEVVERILAIIRTASR